MPTFVNINRPLMNFLKHLSLSLNCSLLLIEFEMIDK